MINILNINKVYKLIIQYIWERPPASLYPSGGGPYRCTIGATSTCVLRCYEKKIKFFLTHTDHF
jgi:hypothetical protein